MKAECCEGCEVSEGCFVNFPGIQINTGCLLKGDRYLFIFLQSLQTGGKYFHNFHNGRRLAPVFFLLLRFGQDGGDLIGGSFDDQPEVTVAGMQAFKTKFFHDAPHLSGCQPYAVTKAGDNLAGCDVTPFFQPVRFPIKSKDQFPGRVGCFKTPVSAVEFVNLFALEPVAETTVEQGFCLRIDGIVVDRMFPGTVDVCHFKNKPSAVSGIVGEEERVVAGSAEGGDVWQPYFVAAIRKSFVDVECGGHCFELVQFCWAHGVDLFEIDQEEFREGQQVVFAKPLAVGLRREVTPEAGWEQVLHERGFVASLAADQHEDDMVDSPFIQCSRQHPHKPAAEIGSEFFRGVVCGMHHRGEFADRVVRTVPGREGIEIVCQRMVFGHEVAGQQGVQAGKVCIDILFLHGSPKGILYGVGHALPFTVALQAYFRLLGESVATDFHVTVNETLHLLDRSTTSCAGCATGYRLFELAELLCGMFGCQCIAAFCSRADGGRIVIGKRIECPCRSLLFRDAEPVHPVEAAADVIVVTVCFVGDSFLFNEAAHGQGCPGNGGFAAAFFHLTCLLACLFVRQWETERVGAVESIGIMADDRHAGRIFAFEVISDTAQMDIIFIDSLPGKQEIMLCGRIFHPDEYPDTDTGDCGMGEEGMRIGFDPDKYFGELPGWDVIDVDHDEPGITGNVCGGTSACERDRSDKGRLGLFDLFFFCFQLREKQIIVVLFRLVQTGNCLPIQFGLRFMKRPCQFVDNRFP